MKGWWTIPSLRQTDEPADRHLEGGLFSNLILGRELMQGGVSASNLIVIQWKWIIMLPTVLRVIILFKSYHTNQQMTDGFASRPNC